MNDSASWCLEGYVDDKHEVWRTMVRRLPFQVGRNSESDLVLPFGRVSHTHAKLFQRQKSLWLRDMGSTNGTFLNGKRVLDDCPLKDGDIVHFADHEFRLVTFSTRQPQAATQTILLDDFHLPASSFDRARDLRDMLEQNGARAVFQPLVGLADGHVMGYEILGRGQLGEVETPPTELFYLAEALGLEMDLSAEFRDIGVAEAAAFSGNPALFVNSHPSELVNSPMLLDSLRGLRERHPEQALTLEIHESAVADLSSLQDLRSELEKIDIGIAFDDFGTGQARLLELTDVAPQFVKFDRAWIKNLHRATQRRLDLVKTLASLVINMGVATIAEGIECQEEADVCLELGFEYAQGYHFGRPSPAHVFARA
ncbi:MAG: EAL domain-containing protein [bacterium]|nr:EAL domain-containing protein [bacterium]